LLPCMSPWQKP